MWNNHFISIYFFNFSASSNQNSNSTTSFSPCFLLPIPTQSASFNRLFIVSLSSSADYKIDLACGPQEIELFIIKNAPARVNYPEALGLRHLAFKVESVDDIVKELNGKGIETEPVRLDDYTGKKMTFFHDPDGLPLEIHE